MGIFFSLSKMFRCSRGRRPRATRPLVLEALEDRLCPSYTTIDLGTLGGGSSTALRINRAGTIVGFSDTSGGATHAFSYSNGQMSDLGTLGGSFSEARSINSAGTIVGNLYTSSQRYHAFSYSGGVMTDLGTCGGTESYAYAIS